MKDWYADFDPSEIEITRHGSRNCRIPTLENAGPWYIVVRHHLTGHKAKAEGSDLFKVTKEACTKLRDMVNKDPYARPNVKV